MKIMLTGGAGYIGSHTAVALLDNDIDVVVLDNFCNSSPESIHRVEVMTEKKIDLIEGDVTDSSIVSAVFEKHDIDGVIHFAGLKAVGESVEQPIRYYRNNLDATLTLLECMEKAGVNNVVFSSSATVYGEHAVPPLFEQMPRGGCTNPYGWTKAMGEQIFEDAVKANPSLSAIMLRYFNPVGAHPSGMIGEDPQGIPNNLMPLITQTAIGRRDHLTIYGNDYDTPDGTCRRDYIHVMDLAKAHVLAVQAAVKAPGGTWEAVNVGTGVPYSVQEMVETFEKVNTVAVPHIMGDRRAGDLAECWADTTKGKAFFDGWQPEYGLAEMCRDAWNWQTKNPQGYRK